MSKYIHTTVTLFERGDFVRTPEGVGIITKSFIQYDNNGNYLYQTIFVQHKARNSDNTNNDITETDNFCVVPISDEEYEGDNNE